jgi:GTP diphosphokinase / guanosine-3',5'-bis(diphosphate) 3'-diphosphatase
LEADKAFLRAYEQQAPAWVQRLEALEEATMTATTLLSPRPDIEARLKSPESVWRKMQRYRLELVDVHDLLGLRLIVETPAQCYEAAELVRSIWAGRCLRFKDYLAHPKRNGYRSLHLWFRLDDGLRLEVQVRTRLMHLRCLMGDTSHERYKRRLEGPIVDQHLRGSS